MSCFDILCFSLIAGIFLDGELLAAIFFGKFPLQEFFGGNCQPPPPPRVISNGPPLTEDKCGLIITSWSFYLFFFIYLLIIYYLFMYLFIYLFMCLFFCLFIFILIFYLCIYLSLKFYNKLYTSTINQTFKTSKNWRVYIATSIRSQEFQTVQIQLILITVSFLCT